jgi:signal transduction histidine kinase
MTVTGEELPLEQKIVQLEAALQKCEKLAVATRYAGAIMHEVNNPLAAITNLVYLTKLQADEPDLVREYMTIIEGQLATLSNVTTQVLTFHRDQPHMKDFDLIDIVESALKLHAARLTSGEVALIRSFKPPATASVFGSEILQVVSNLLLNALDALPTQGAELRIRIKTVRDSVHIIIADNGAGMSAETVGSLFEPYKSTKPFGTGLGLWLSHRIMKKHNGHIRVRSSQAKGRQGTTFRLSVPTKSAA